MEGGTVSGPGDLGGVGVGLDRGLESNTLICMTNLKL